MEISLISTFIKYTYINEHLGNAIVKDMQRGMSRHIVVFKFIFMLYDYMKDSNEFKLNSRHDMKCHPKLFLKNFINEYIGCYLKKFEMEFMRKIECEGYISIIEESKGILDSLVILESYASNKVILDQSFESELNLKDLKLLDIFLNDLTVLELPNRIDIDIENYFDDNMELIIKIENLFKKSNMIKFHIHPDDVTYV